MTPPGGWGEYLAAQLGIEWYRVPVVILSAAIIYLAFLVLVRFFGPRVLTVTTVTDAVVVIMLGAVAGRVIIGHPPTVLAGIIGLATLVAMESLFRAFNHTGVIGQLFSSRPVLVFVHGRPIDSACKKTHTSIPDLNAAMRKAGVAHYSDVQCIILEPRGSYSVIREGVELSPDLFSAVEGAREHLFGEAPAKGI